MCASTAPFKLDSILFCLSFFPRKNSGAFQATRHTSAQKNGYLSFLKVNVATSKEKPSELPVTPVRDALLESFARCLSWFSLGEFSMPIQVRCLHYKALVEGQFATPLDPCPFVRSRCNTTNAPQLCSNVISRAFTYSLN